MDSCGLFSPIIKNIDQLETDLRSKDPKKFLSQIKESAELSSDDAIILNDLVEKVQGLEKKINRIREGIIEEINKQAKTLDSEATNLKNLQNEIDSKKDSKVRKIIKTGADYGDTGSGLAYWVIGAMTVAGAISTGPLAIPVGLGIAAGKAVCHSTKKVLNDDLVELEKYKKLNVDDEFDKRKKQITLKQDVTTWKDKEIYTSLATKLKSKESTRSFGKDVKEYVNLINRRYKYEEKFKKLRDEILPETKKTLIEKSENAKEYLKKTDGTGTRIITEIENSLPKMKSPPEAEKNNETKASES